MRKARTRSMRGWTWAGSLTGLIAVAVLGEIVRDVYEGTSLREFASSFVECLLSKPVWIALAGTLGRFSAGFLLGVSVACALGLVMGRVRSIESFMSPSVGFLKAIPSAAVIPLALLTFKYGGSAMKVGIIAYGVMWPVLLQVFHGCKDLDHILLDSGRTLGKSRWTIFWRIVLPATLPNIMTGARVGLGIGLLLAVTAEMLLGGDGLGFLIRDYELSFKYAEMLATIFVLGLLGMLLDELFRRLEGIMLPWVPGRNARNGL